MAHRGGMVGRPRGRKHLKIDDSFWMWLESPETPMHVAALAIFETDGEDAVTVAKRIVTTFREQTECDQRFQSLIQRKRFPRRAQRGAVDDVEIDFHLRHEALPAPGGELELAQLISRLHSIQLDARRPMWEVHVIEGLQGNRFAIYTKVHHALMNGVDAVRLLGRALATDAEAAIPDPMWVLGRPPRSTPPSTTRTRRKRLRMWKASLEAVDSLRRARHTDSSLVGPFVAPRSALNVEIGPQRRVCTASIDLSRVKQLAKRSGASVNDVVLAACSAALRRYLLDVGGLPDKPLIAGCPVSIASEGASPDSSVGIMLADLATDEADPVTRLSAISRSARAAKEHQSAVPHGALVAYSILAMLPHTVRQVVPGAVRTLPPMFNLIISNVPGPQQTLYLGGARMVGLFPLSLLFKGEALNITVVSHAGRMNFGFTACRRSLPHVQRIGLYLEDAFDELDRVVGGSDVGEVVGR
ncbi:wax ester/triacylglycerol synthase family O-acyltransferase [Nocardia asteroides]|uniref:wax ester/triacylglycerol synthase family O-acyltransferase n=1 Tax=Nocardia asteroides TaxID=1824 RepID=UPI0037CC7BCF